MKESSSISRVVRSSRKNEVQVEAFCTHPFTDIVGNDGDISEVKRFRRQRGDRSMWWWRRLVELEGKDSARKGTTGRVHRLGVEKINVRR